MAIKKDDVLRQHEEAYLALTNAAEALIDEKIKTKYTPGACGRVTVYLTEIKAIAAEIDKRLRPTQAMMDDLKSRFEAAGWKVQIEFRQNERDHIQLY